MAQRAVANGAGFGQGLLKAVRVPVRCVDLEPRGRISAGKAPELAREVRRIAAPAAWPGRAGALGWLEVGCQLSVRAAEGVGGVEQVPV